MILLCCVQEGNCVTQQLIDSSQAKCLDTSFIYKDDPYMSVCISYYTIHVISCI